MTNRGNACATGDWRNAAFVLFFAEWPYRPSQSRQPLNALHRCARLVMQQFAEPSPYLAPRPRRLTS